jgi:hypothetical protein
VFVYWIIFVVLATGALLNQEEHVSRTRLMFVALASLPTALMIGLRWQIGPDWRAYLDIFNYTKLYSLAQAISHQDPGFTTLNLLLHQFNAPFWVLNLVCGTVFVAGLTAFCRRQPNPWLAYLVAFPYLVIVVAMSGNRQSVALGLLFFALNAFERGRLNRFVLLILMAALFHGSVLLMLPLCLLSYTRNSLQRALLLLIAGALGVYYFQDVFSVYARRYSSEKIQSTGVAYRLAMNAMSALLFLFFERRFALDERQTKLWRTVSLCTLGLVLLLAVVPSSTAIDRFLLYLFPLQFVVLSRLPKVMTRDDRASVQITSLVIGYAALVQVTFLTLGTFSSFYIPYRSVLQQ